jgi:2-desacetyl-2-hydroxyethyl bacteriochlorophyllide A dehydrogenase
MKKTALYFTAPFQVEVWDETLVEPSLGEVVVRTLCSGISSGTELLLYRGEFPPELPVDETLSSLMGAYAYPQGYGYSAVGEVVGLGAGVAESWLGRRVFAFQPHASFFISAVQDLQPVPEGLTIEDAVFLPNMETAINLIHDGKPLAGEQVAVIGQGVVGLLVSALLVQFPLASLVTLDRFTLRRQISNDLGVTACLDPDQTDCLELAQRSLQNDRRYSGADLVYELSGAPTALDLAIALGGFNSRVVIGSWYGTKRAAIGLGGRFHRERIQLISSQVSSIAPELSGRWEKSRRFNLAWVMLQRVRPSRLITQRFSLTQASQAYQLIDQNPGETIQVIFEYP